MCTGTTAQRSMRHLRFTMKRYDMNVTNVVSVKAGLRLRAPNTTEELVLILLAPVFLRGRALSVD